MPRARSTAACRDFHRASDAVRGRYLASGMTRREVLGAGLGAGLSVYAAKAMSFAQVLERAEAQAADAPDAPVLVAVYLSGGIDLLDTIVPVHQYGRYAELHGTLRVPEPLPLADTGLGAHPALAAGTDGGLVGLAESQRIGWLVGTHHEDNNLSHFQEYAFRSQGFVSTRAGTGWLGRALDASGSENPLQGITVGSTLSSTLITARAPVASITSPEAAQLAIPEVPEPQLALAMQAWARMADRRPQAHGPAADRLRPFAGQDAGAPVEYPQDNPLGDSLGSLAALLSLPLGVRVATIEAPTQFDTHDNQALELDRELRGVSEALSAFQADLRARGLEDRVLTFVWSEFGRRPVQNDTGTDHGAAGLAWVQGTRARAGVLSDYPDLFRFDRDDNLVTTVDFRRVYAGLLSQWLSVDPAAVLPDAARFGELGLVA